MSEEGFPFLPHCFRRSLWTLGDRRMTWAILILLALVGGLYLWQAGEVATIQYHIRELEKEKQDWRIKNTELQREIAELTRVTTLTERAQALGFTVPHREVYISLPEGVASDGAGGVSHE